MEILTTLIEGTSTGPTCTIAHTPMAMAVANPCSCRILVCRMSQAAYTIRLDHKLLESVSAGEFMGCSASLTRLDLSCNRLHAHSEGELGGPKPRHPSLFSHKHMCLTSTQLFNTLAVRNPSNIIVSVIQLQLRLHVSSVKTC